MVVIFSVKLPFEEFPRTLVVKPHVIPALSQSIGSNCQLTRQLGVSEEGPVEQCLALQRGRELTQQVVIRLSLQMWSSNPLKRLSFDGFWRPICMLNVEETG